MIGVTFLSGEFVARHSALLAPLRFCDRKTTTARPRLLQAKQEKERFSEAMVLLDRDNHPRRDGRSNNGAAVEDADGKCAFFDLSQFKPSVTSPAD